MCVYACWFYWKKSFIKWDLSFQWVSFFLQIFTSSVPFPFLRNIHYFLSFCKHLFSFHFKILFLFFFFSHGKRVGDKRKGEPYQIKMFVLILKTNFIKKTHKIQGKNRMKWFYFLSSVLNFPLKIQVWSVISSK